jgi:predicted DNA-binding transcriptional regulator AlpA
MNDRLITPQEAQRKMGVTSRSTFWEIINKNAKLAPRVEYTPKCIRFLESGIDALIEKHLVKSPGDRARLADGRRS